MSAPDAPRLVTFGVFEFDPTTGDLWKAGHRVRLQDQPRQVLAALATRPAELITREDLRAVLWPDDTFVDFDTGLNVVVNKLRQALGDSASAPRFIETIPRRGYRFVAPVSPAKTGDLPSAEPLPTSQAEAAPRTPSEIDTPADRLSRCTSRRWPRPLHVLATAGLFSAALWGASGWRTEVPVSTGVRVETLAVLPLENLSGNPADEYFADGMTEALITDLASIRAVNVIARQSTKRYKGSSKTISAIAKELKDPDVIVEGSVLRTDSRVRLTVKLVDVQTERAIWVRTYEQDLSDILQLQREAARTIAEEIRASLTPAESARLGSGRQVNTAALHAYYRGQYLLAGKAEAEPNMLQALAEFQHAIELDPTFAPAYVGVAEVQQLRGTNLGGRPPLQTRPLAFRAVRRALQLDPDLGAAHDIMGRLQLSEFDWPGAERSFARMLELAPGRSQGPIWYAYHLLLKGRADEALEVAKRAEALDPHNLNTRVRVGFIQTFRRRRDLALGIFEEVLALDPNNLVARNYLVNSLLALGQTDRALNEATSLIDRHGRQPLTLARLAGAHAGAGNRLAAERVIAELLEMSRREYVPPAHVAVAYHALGDRDHAFRWFELAYEERSVYMMYFPISTSIDWQDDPRYVRLVAKIRRPHTVRDGS